MYNSSTQTRNTCFLCSTNGQPIEECCIKDAACEYTPGHGRNKKAVTCTWFDGQFPAGGVVANAQRDSKIKDAARLRAHALKYFRKKRAKLAKEPQ